MASASKRIHSIYVLRMFNDPVAMGLLYLSLMFLGLALNRRLSLLASVVLYSVALSVKMNILLFAPAYGLILLAIAGWQWSSLGYALAGLLVQITLAWPFLRDHPRTYLSGAFDFSRQFLYEWTVNWRFLGKAVFEDPRRGPLFLAGHLISLACWVMVRRVHRTFFSSKPQALRPATVVLWLSEVNLIGIIWCRSLHYQFYVWYFFTIPLLLWQCTESVPIWFR